jgi:dCTP diphosphatase
LKNETLDLELLKNKLREFSEERDWGKYHNPKNLAMALSVETSELVEIFQWLTEQESNEIISNSEKMDHIKEEISDILLYTIRLADVLKINIPESIEIKLDKNKEKYPIGKSKGNAKKYSEF